MSSLSCCRLLVTGIADSAMDKQCSIVSGVVEAMQAGRLFKSVEL